MLEVKQSRKPKRTHSSTHGNQILAVGLNHRTAPVEERESLAFSGAEVEQALHRLSEQLDSAVLISTCNRTELYTTGFVPSDTSTDLVGLLTGLKGVYLDRSRFYVNQHEAAVRHLYRVAAGIDSMVVGEGQIL
ncbi:MAG TPA: hypothetical protein VFB90_03765, partial [Dehalococcoidia bacterium]|nr:hypothetical protein [Dehalococcoidia bacterium]